MSCARTFEPRKQPQQRRLPRSIRTEDRGRPRTTQAERWDIENAAAAALHLYTLELNVHRLADPRPAG